MERIALTDGSGKWFDVEKATEFEEDTRWDGSNHISRATGDKFTHETLFRTASGRWVLHWWSQWQGTEPTYEEIGDEAAAAWLVRNDHESEIVADQIAALEL